MYTVPVPQKGEQVQSYADYLKLRDPLNGWPYPNELGLEEFDRDGARKSRQCSRNVSDENCISTYGDSFTFGSEVDNDACWSSALSEIMGCCVKNFGVPGYGSDQAYLRFTKQKMDIAQITILGFMSENIIRNLTRNWDLISTVGYYGLKPRFSINKEKSLTLVPLPELSEKQYLQSIGLKSPQLQLPHENFQPGGAAGEVQLAFPYTLSVIRNLQSSRMLCSRRQEPYHLQFYEEDHSLRGLDVTVKIFEKSLKRVRKEEAGHSSCCWSIYMNCIPTEKPAYGHMVT